MKSMTSCRSDERKGEWLPGWSTKSFLRLTRKRAHPPLLRRSFRCIASATCSRRAVPMPTSSTTERWSDEKSRFTVRPAMRSLAQICVPADVHPRKFGGGAASSFATFVLPPEGPASGSRRRLSRYVANSATKPQKRSRNTSGSHSRSSVAPVLIMTSEKVCRGLCRSLLFRSVSVPLKPGWSGSDRDACWMRTTSSMLTRPRVPPLRRLEMLKTSLNAESLPDRSCFEAPGKPCATVAALLSTASQQIVLHAS